MASYPKIWTSILDEKWFIPLSCNQRGVFLQLILLAKKQGDSGLIFSRSYRTLADNLGINRSTLANTLLNFEPLGICRVVEKSARLLVLELPKYKKYQGLRSFKDVYDDKNNGQKPVENPATIDPITLKPKNLTEVKEKWNQICVSLNPIIEIKNERLENFRDRIREYGFELEFWETLFRRIEDSDFLTKRIEISDNHRNWKCDFDWVLKPGVINKILEGKYDNTEAGTATWLKEFTG